MSASVHSSYRVLYATDKLHLAHCAMLRSRQCLTSEHSWLAEYNTMRMWMRHQCLNLPGYNYLDQD